MTMHSSTCATTNVIPYLIESMHANIEAAVVRLAQ